MGSLLKGPKPPSTPTQTFTSVTPETVSTTTTAEADTPTVSEQQAEARKQSLLRRSRGRLGTIISSFSGILSPQSAANGSTRKTLLGE